MPSAANVHDTRLFPHLLRLALAACAAVGRLYADAGYDSALKLLFLVLNLAEREWRMPPGEWAMAKAQFAILFEERFRVA